MFCPIFKLQQEGLIDSYDSITVWIGSLQYYISSTRMEIFVAFPPSLILASRTVSSILGTQ